MPPRQPPTVIERLAADEATAREAINELAARGKDALPGLEAAAKHPDPLVRRRAREVLGRISGQWGSQTGMVWKRSLKDAVGEHRWPILVLHLFGKFDEEFC